jgi:VanZ family protein
VDEWHQQFVPGRSASVEDWIADALGAIAGTIAYTSARARREIRT